MPFLQTRYFGELDYSAESVIRMPAGIPGFKDESTFLLIQLPGQYPLVYLQSMQTPELCFPALPVRVADAAYELEISDEDVEILGVQNRPRIGSDVLCLALLASDPKEGTTANLMAPVVVHIATRTGAQCLNSAGPYLCRQPLTGVGEAVPA